MGSESSWTPDGQGVQWAGQIGGDDQVTDSWSVRYHHADRPGSLINVYFYGTSHSYGSIRSSEYGVTQQIELMVCDDRTDPGSTEQWSECLHFTSDERYSSAQEAEQIARQSAERHTVAELASDTNWGGLAPWERED